MLGDDLIGDLLCGKFSIVLVICRSRGNMVPPVVDRKAMIGARIKRTLSRTIHGKL